MMIGAQAPNGVAMLVWQPESDPLLAPEGKKYLPCDRCGRIVPCDPEAVALSKCGGCARVDDEDKAVEKWHDQWGHLLALINLWIMTRRR